MTRLVVALVAAFALAAAPALAGNGNGNKNKGNGGPPGQGGGNSAVGNAPSTSDAAAAGTAAVTGAVLGSVLFGADQQRIIRDYFQQYPMGAKPLPPGIQKKLARGGSMPPGIAKNYLPQGLNTRLPALDPRYSRVVSGTDVLLVEVATGVIMDVLRGAAR